MSNKKKTSPLAGVRIDDLLFTLKRRAMERAHARGHSIGVWISAKRRDGKGAQRAVCVYCADEVVVMPHGMQDGKRRGAIGPAIKGDGVFEECGMLGMDAPRRR